ncbi:MAG: hypothetical protein PSX36_14635 [bacterium]|nr:hypothetical protein [bacterium]
MLKPTVTIRIIALLVFMFVLAKTGRAQSDTLHLYYIQTQSTIQDSTNKKIDNWVKSLNGKHVDIDVVAYYSKLEYKKFAQQRNDELFLVLNRKARALITIGFIGPKKGENSQRTTVDIIYHLTGTPKVAPVTPALGKKEKTPETAIEVTKTKTEPNSKSAVNKDSLALAKKAEKELEAEKAKITKAEKNRLKAENDSIAKEKAEKAKVEKNKLKAVNDSIATAKKDAEKAEAEKLKSEKKKKEETVASDEALKKDLKAEPKEEKEAKSTKSKEEKAEKKKEKEEKTEKVKEEKPAKVKKEKPAKEDKEKEKKEEKAEDKKEPEK